MTEDRRVLSLLTEVLDGFSSSAPDGLLASVLDGVRTTPQRGRWRSVRGWLRFVPDPFTRQPVAASLLVVVVAVVAVTLLRLVPQAGTSGPGNPAPSPTPSSNNSPSPSPGTSGTRRSTFDGTEVAIEDTGSTGLVSGVAYTSSAFKPQVAFRLHALGQKQETGQETDWCSPRGSDAPTPHTSPRAMVLAWRYACLSDLRIIRPFAVDCGTPDAHPDAAALAAAILANPGIGNIHDRGTLQTPGAVPSSLFLGKYSGRVLEIIRSRDLAPKVPDPDGCRLLPELGTGDPTIEIRGDQNSKLILVDVGGELVIVRAGSAGHDGPTGAAAEARGYGDLGVLDSMLTGIYDVEFR
jgi:hypothetical protein